MNNHERGFAARLILCRCVNGDLPRVVDLVSLDDQRLRVIRIDRAEDLPSNPRIEEFCLLRIDRELLHFSLGNSVDNFVFRSRQVFGPDQKITVHIERRIQARLRVEPHKLRCSWTIKLPSRRRRPFGWLRER